MCLDFNKLDKAMILDNLESLVNFKIKEDPVLGAKNPTEAIWENFPKKHGTLIQRSLLEFMRCIKGWDGKVEFKFIPSKDLRIVFYDNLIFNKDFEIAILFECKRNLQNVSGPYEENIKRYHETCKFHAKDITKKLGFSGPKQKLFFSIFDAYGQGKNTHFKGYPITIPDDLNKLFPSCLFDAWLSLESEVATKLNEYKIPISEDFKERANNAPNLEELEERMNGDEEERVVSDDNRKYKTPEKIKVSEFFGETYI